jgi:peptidoglycan/xylan/chitin deacetylase (PgdA/CDA1 family)
MFLFSKTQAAENKTLRELMKQICIFIFLLFIVSSIAQQKQVCISIDDLPVVEYGSYDTVLQQRIMANLIRSLKKNKIPAIGFVNETKLYNYAGKLQPVQVHLLTQWLNNGLMLGNHTFSHPDYSTVPFEDFTRDILKGETITKKILQKKGLKERYFRHPYLHVGTTKAKADSLEVFLNKHGYITAPITFNTQDYAFAYAYYKAKTKKDTVLEKKIVTDYHLYVNQIIKHFEKESIGIFGRPIHQIILLHASMLNSEQMDAIIEIFRKNGYGFVPIDKALKDPAYQTPVTVFGNLGSSWIDRWALSLNKKGDFLRGTPELPSYIVKMLAE